MLTFAIRISVADGGTVYIHVRANIIKLGEGCGMVSLPGTHWECIKNCSGGTEFHHGRC